MKSRILTLCAAMLLLALTACDSSSSIAPVVQPPPPPPPPAPTGFTNFVKAQFAATSDMTGPVDVDDEDFDFSNEDPTAYDDLLQ